MRELAKDKDGLLIEFIIHLLDGLIASHLTLLQAFDVLLQICLPELYCLYTKVMSTSAIQ